jgi:hypothetical protein
MKFSLNCPNLTGKCDTAEAGYSHPAGLEIEMKTVVLEHVHVTELPDAWRKRLSVPADARVTVRIEDETTPVRVDTSNADSPRTVDPAFGIWRDHENTADVEGYVRELREPRYRRDGTRNDD